MSIRASVKWFQLRRLVISLPSRLLRQWPAWLYVPAAAIAALWSALSAVTTIPPPQTAMLAFEVAGAAFLLHVPWAFLLHDVLRVPTTLPLRPVPELVTPDTISPRDSFVLLLRAFGSERGRPLRRKTRERRPRLVMVRIGHHDDYYDDPGGTEEHFDHTYGLVETELPRVVSQRVVALVNSDDPAPPAGIRFVLVDQLNWEAVVATLITRAYCVVFVPDGGSIGIEKEAELLSRLSAASKTIVVSKTDGLPTLSTAAHAAPDARSLEAAISKLAPAILRPSRSEVIKLRIAE